MTTQSGPTITKEQFGLWKSHPVTQLFFRFMDDRNLDITSHVMEGWVKGTIEFEKESQVNRGRILELLDLYDLTHEQIVNFYQERDNATKIAEDDTR
jgi:hypothetical protein